jgi:hypothetical protein
MIMNVEVVMMERAQGRGVFKDTIISLIWSGWIKPTKRNRKDSR